LRAVSPTQQPDRMFRNLGSRKGPHQPDSRNWEGNQQRRERERVQYHDFDGEEAVAHERVVAEKGLDVKWVSPQKETADSTGRISW
jgi:hypothetical protein